MKSDMAHGFVEFEIGANVYDEILTLFTMYGSWFFISTRFHGLYVEMI